MISEEEDSPEDEEEPIVIPILKGSKVVELKIDNAYLPLKTPISFEDFTEFLKNLIEVQKYLDLGVLGKKKSKKQTIITVPWTESNFKSLWRELSSQQKDLIQIIYSRQEIKKEELFEEMVKKGHVKEDDIHSLYALMAGLSKKLNSKGLESLFDKKEGTYTKKADIVDLLKKIKNK